MQKDLKSHYFEGYLKDCTLGIFQTCDSLGLVLTIQF